MEKHIVKVLQTEMLTHNVKRFIVERPPGYNFIPGQATDVSINKPGQENELRPFTFTSTNEDKYLEFIIKIYTGHNGMTEKLHGIEAGHELIIHEVFGTISYQGEGLFIAGGAGITPFISIFRDLRSKSKLGANVLLFANKTTDDIILRKELKLMLGLNDIDVLEIPADPWKMGAYINKDLLKPYVDKKTRHYYVCGPGKFTDIMIDYLLDLGVEKSHIVYEQ